MGGRTRLISLTRFGRWLIELAHEHCILSGDMPLEVNRALAGPREREKPNRERYEGARIAVKLTKYFGWMLEGAGDLYLWHLGTLAGLLDWPISESAHYELRVADEGTMEAPKFEAGDLLAEIEEGSTSRAL